jgi:hypothetical protein
VAILKSETQGTVVRRILLGSGLGNLFGLQACRLAGYFTGNAVPRLGLAWILVSHALLGITIAGTSGLARWWKRGLPLGVLFAIPAATFSYAMGWQSAGIAETITGAVAGLLIALLVDAMLPGAPRPLAAAAPSVPGREAHPVEHSGPSGADIRKRLSEGEAELDRLAGERRRRGDPHFGKAVEDRIVWGELLELELQEIDERVSRTGNTDGGSGEPQDRDEA